MRRPGISPGPAVDGRWTVRAPPVSLVSSLRSLVARFQTLEIALAMSSGHERAQLYTLLTYTAPDPAAQVLVGQRAFLILNRTALLAPQTPLADVVPRLTADLTDPR